MNVHGIRQHVEDFEEYLHSGAASLSDTQKIEAYVSYLPEEYWTLQRWNQERWDQISWDTFKAQIIETMQQEADKPIRFRQLHKVQQGPQESLKCYTERVSSLVDQVFMGD